MRLVHQKRRQTVFLAGRNQKKFRKDINVLHNEERITQHKPFVPDFKIRKMKDTMRKIATWKMTWKLHQSSVTIDFNSYLKDLKESSETDGLQKVIRNF